MSAGIDNLGRNAWILMASIQATTLKPNFDIFDEYITQPRRNVRFGILELCNRVTKPGYTK